MKTGIIATGYTDIYGEKEGLERCRAHGYDCVDYQGFIDTESGTLKLGTAEFEKKLKEYRALCENCGITVWQTHGPWHYPPNDRTKEDRAKRLESAKKSAYGTAVLGCGYMVMHHIMPFDFIDTDKDAVRDINAEFFSSLSDYAKQFGVCICLENMPFPDQALARVSDMLDFVRYLGDGNIRLCLDTGHCAVLGGSAADAVRAAGKEYLKVLHAHDNDGKGDFHQLPGTGVIDWNDFSSALKEIGFDGCVSLETFVKDAEGKERGEKEKALFKSVYEMTV